jgi:hypothetical protein
MVSRACTSILRKRVIGMDRANEDLRTQFIGDVVRHTEGGVVHCQAEPGMADVDFGPHNCESQMEGGDVVIVYYVKDHERDDEDWLQMYRFCSNCDNARNLSSRAREEGKEQAVVEGTLEPFEGVVEGEFYEDAVRLMDVQMHAYSPESEG